MNKNDSLSEGNGYVTQIPEYSYLIERKEFIKEVKSSLFTDYDGFGHPAKDDLMDQTVYIWPSRISSLPEDCTHIVWFNK
jgi:hypothetical protein